MTTEYKYNTGNPIGSYDVRDGVDNLKSFDVLMNSTDMSYEDRTGHTVPTVHGAMKKIGFMPAAFDFDSGGTLGATDRNLVVYYPADGYWYAWGGTLPKTIQPMSSPESAGGIDVNAWRPWVSSVVSHGETVTLNVPSQYEDVQAAFDAIQSWVISGTVIIQVADGTYDWTRTQKMNHPFGNNIKVQGNVSNPNNCVIRGTNPPTFDMFVTDNGHNLGYFDGFLVTLSAKATLANNWTAVLANNGGSIICGNNVKTNNWYYGIAARNGSFVKCQYANVNNAGDVGIWSMNGSAVDAQYATSTNASDTTNNWGFGFQAEYGSFINCSNGSASGCNIAGIAALSNSTVRALTCNASSNVGSGIYAAMDGTVECHNATANNNTRYGTERSLGGVIIGGNLTTTGNTLGAYAGYAYWDNSGTLGARIAANGTLRIDNNGADPVYFNTSGGIQFAIQHNAAATSQLYVMGGNAATGDQPIIGTRGGAANISFRTQAKGNGAHYFNNDKGIQFEISGGGTANVVNHVYAKGGEAGKPVTLGASGSDAIVDLQLLPKGVGSYVQLGAGSFPVTTETVQRYLSVKDAAGNICKLAVLV